MSVGLTPSTWVLGDQLHRRIGALAHARPGRDRVLLVVAEDQLDPRRHRQRLHLHVAAIHRFAASLRADGFDVDLRHAPTLGDGVRAHVAEHAPPVLTTTEANTAGGRRLQAHLAATLPADGVTVRVVRSNQFLTHPDEFAAWAGDRRPLRMEDFYRWQRRRLDVLVDPAGDPVGGRWNFDHDNRRPPPDDDPFPTPLRDEPDDLDATVLTLLGDRGWGADPEGWWPTSREGALARLEHFVTRVLPLFGPYEDAITTRSWHLGHSLLSPALNLGLLLPDEVVEAVVARLGDDDVGIASIEGFVRQVIGWREFVWGISWLWPEQATQNVYGHDAPLPPAFTGAATTDLACVAAAVDAVEQRGWTHHIQRLMVLANLGNLVGVDPAVMAGWMGEVFVDATGWVMVPNVVGMATWSDGGWMATKPYVSGGAYINTMSDHCRGCRFDPRRRTGDDACPFTSLYWDFLARHEDVLAGNHRLARPLASMRRLADLGATRARAAEVRADLLAGEL